MASDRMLDAYCTTCLDVLPHRSAPSDPGSCRCAGCGGVQLLMVPLAQEPAAVRPA